MKKIILLLSSFLVNYFSFAQSGTIAPNYVVIPGVATLSACTNADKGKTVFNTTNNKMFFCDGTAWQSMAGVPSAGVGWAQNGADISNTNSGKVGIGTNTPTLPLSVKGSLTSGEVVSIQNSTGTVNLVTDIADVGSSSVAKIRTNTSSDLWLSASKLLPDLRIQTNGNVNLASFTTGKVGIGTSIPDEKLHVSGNIKTNEGIYASSTGGLNIVPLGVINIDYYINTDVELFNLIITNKAGNLATGSHSYTAIDGGDDTSFLEVYLDVSLLSPYSQVVLVGAPKFDQSYGPYINEAWAVYLYNGGLARIKIKMGSDDFTGCLVSGDYIIYGIK